MTVPLSSISTVADSSQQDARSATHDATPHSGSETWRAFAAATSSDAFCRAWLTLQCTMISGTRAGLLLMKDASRQSFVPAAVWPDPRRDVSYLGASAETALTQRRGTVITHDENASGRVSAGSAHVAYPLEVDGEIEGAVIIDVAVRPEGELQLALRQLFWGAGWLDSLLRRNRNRRDARILERASVAMHLVQAVQEQDTLEQAAISAVNELAARMGADRASLGVERSGKLQLSAISRTAWFDSKSQLVEMIECAMEEAIDQEAPSGYPAIGAARGKILVAQRDLAQRAGAVSVLSVPLMNAGRAIGAVTLERNQEPGFDDESVLIGEAACELIGPAFAARMERDRWIAGRAIDALAGWRDRIIGPRHPASKLLVAAAIVAVAFLALVDGEFRVTARAVIEAEQQRAITAPYDAFVARAHVRAGDTVRKGQLLAELDDRELQLEQVKWQSERDQAAQKYREALAIRDRPGARIQKAQLSQAEAQLALNAERIRRARITAPFDAVIVSGDLSQRLGSPVERGVVLFEMAPLESYRVILKVDEHDVDYVKPGQSGELTLTGLAGSALSISVTNVTSVSTPKEGKNYFRAEADLRDAHTRLRPGMEGIGKLAVGERRLVWIWTRGFVDWLRIKLWSWLP